MSAYSSLSGSPQDDASKKTPLRIGLGCVVAALSAYVLFHGVPGAALPADVSESTCGGVPEKSPAMVRRTLDGKVRNVLITGGAGFIASHFALALLDRRGFNVTVLDDMSRGSMDTVIRLQALAKQSNEPLAFEQLDVSNQNAVEEVLRARRIDTVVHFSGNAYVGESMAHPEDYFQNITVRLLIPRPSPQPAPPDSTTPPIPHPADITLKCIVCADPVFIACPSCLSPLCEDHAEYPCC